MKVIHTDQAPAAVGPYSQAIEANGVLYCSGQIAINPAEGKIVATTIEGQAEQCCRNVEAVLKEAATSSRRRASSRRSRISRPSMKSTPSISSPSRPGAAWRSRTCQPAHSAR